MLVLSRRRSESIRFVVPASNVPQTIDVLVSEIRPSTVRLVMNAPRDITIVRNELIEAPAITSANAYSS